MLTQERVKELFEYNPEIGDLIRKVATSGNTEIGEVAGGIKSIGYWYVSVDNKRYLSHRIIWLWMTGDFPKKHIDHIDGNGTNNKFENLRDVNVSHNHRNMKRAKNNTSGCTGVCYRKDRDSWYARIKVDSKYIHLGERKDKLVVIGLRKAAEKKYGFHPNHDRII